MITESRVKVPAAQSQLLVTRKVVRVRGWDHSAEVRASPPPLTVLGCERENTATGEGAGPPPSQDHSHPFLSPGLTLNTVLKRGPSERKSPALFLWVPVSRAKLQPRGEVRRPWNTRWAHNSCPMAWYTGKLPASPGERQTGRQTEREEEVEVNSMSLTKNYAEKSVETFSVSPEKGTCKHSTLRFDKENKYFNIFW